MHEVVVLMDVPDEEHMLLQNLQIVAPAKVMFLGRKKMVTSCSGPLYIIHKGLRIGVGCGLLPLCLPFVSLHKVVM